VNVRLRLENLAVRLVASAAVFSLCAGLAYLVVCDFVVGALTDSRVSITAKASPAAFITAPFADHHIGINPDVLAAVARRFPSSARLHLRLGEFEKYTGKDNWRAAEVHARRAIALSPHDYRPRLLLAEIQDYRQELDAAEKTTREVLQLTPSHLQAHWQLGTLLLRQGRLPESLQEFRRAALGHPTFLQEGLKEIWSVAAGNFAALRAITPDSAKDKLALARFLLEKSLAEESAAVVREIPGDRLLGERENSRYLDSLIAAGHFALAHELWYRTLKPGSALETIPDVMWNGGFESDIFVDFAQFDWSIQQSKYAQISIDNKTANSGQRSLRIDFVGRETTRLEEEIRQLTLVRPGAHYRLRYYFKTENLSTPEGPRVLVTGTTSREQVTVSDPVSPGSSNWQERTLEFVPSGSTVIVAIQQKPRFSFEDPTHGTVWFDDFEIREI
jgi:tetratricopeptide (TPR) repeat protein